MRFVYGCLALIFIGLYSLWTGGDLSPIPPVFTASEISRMGNVPNAVSYIYLSLRLYDTLFEVLVFSVAIFGVSLFLEEDDLEGARVSYDPPIQVTARGAGFFSILLGFALALTGHLEPGGGFAAGVAAATGLVLVSLGENIPFSQLKEKRLVMAEKCVLLLFLAASFPALTGRGFLSGPFGSIFSGGLILPLNVIVGLKVALGGFLVALLFLRHRWIF